MCWPEISKLLAREDDVDVTPDGMVEMMGQLGQLVQSRGTRAHRKICAYCPQSWWVKLNSASNKWGYCGYGGLLSGPGSGKHTLKDDRFCCSSKLWKGQPCNFDRPSRKHCKSGSFQYRLAARCPPCYPILTVKNDWFSPGLSKISCHPTLHPQAAKAHQIFEKCGVLRPAAHHV